MNRVVLERPDGTTVPLFSAVRCTVHGMPLRSLTLLLDDVVRCGICGLAVEVVA